jgi:hypothetical protein
MTRWAGRRVDHRTILYLCRPLACPEKTSVKVRTARSPTRTPDPIALEKLAKETFPTNVEADNLKLETASHGYVKLDLLGTNVTSIRDFPAVVVELKKTGEGRPIFGRRIFLFAGNTLIDVYCRFARPRARPPLFGRVHRRIRYRGHSPTLVTELAPTA